MDDALAVVNQDIQDLASELDEVREAYGQGRFSDGGTDAESTGHTELSDQLPGFCGFVEDVIGALTDNLDAFAEQLRESAQMYCTAEEDAFTTIQSVQIPDFDVHPGTD